MTRYARAKGSKSSNERVPEEATSWQVMKQQLEEKKHEALENKKRKEFENVRKENYKAFLEEKENDVKDEWAKFEDPSRKQGNNAKKCKKLKSGIDDEHKLNEIISKIEEVLEEKGDTKEDQTNKKTKKKRNVTENIDTMENGESKFDDDDAPDEMSAKVIPVLNKNKKKNKLPKKVPLKIPSVTTNKETIDENIDLHESENEIEKLQVSTEKDKKVKINKDINEEKPKKSLENMTKKEIKQLNKKKAKRMRYLENRKKQKAEQKEKAPADENQNKRKLPNENDDKEYKRRKPNSRVTKININGEDIDIDYYDGFPVKKEDAERLRKLKKEMISKGVPRKEIQIALKLERRKAEKALAREKKKVCFNCRKSGHLLSECPNLNENAHQEIAGTGICFKCGSTEHTHFECKVVRNDNFKYATCFICREQGHISRQCPDNQKGLYPKGGACKVCGDVTHLKKDCPKYQAEQESEAVKLETLEFNNLESLPEEKVNVKKQDKKSNKIVKF